MGRFDHTAAPEASGLAASRRNPDVLYIVDDGPGTTSLLVVEGNTTLGEIHVEGLEGVDTEDLAVARCRPEHPRPCIYIGDIGDNVRARKSVAVHRVPEPDLSRGLPAEFLPSDRIELRYPDRAHDAETLLVDDHGTIGIVTKDPGRAGRGAARLYTADGFADATLRPGRRVRLPAPTIPAAARLVGHVVTGGDLARGAVVLRTYDAVYELRGAGPMRAFPTWPAVEVGRPREPQGEAVAYEADGCGILTVSEASPRITAIPCR